MVSIQNDELTKQIIEIKKNHSGEKTEAGGLKIENLLTDRLKHDPDNIDLLFRLAMLNVYEPFTDYPACCVFFERVIAVSKKHESIANICIKYNDYDFFAIKHAISWIFEGKDRNLINDTTNQLLNQIIETGKCNNVPEAKVSLEGELKHKPNNVETLFLLAMLEPWDKAIELFKKIINISKENEAIATVFYAYLVDIHYIIDQDLLNRLNSLQTDNPEINSMIKYAISWFYAENTPHNNPILEEKYLKESIELYQGHAWNYVHLAELYNKQGMGIKAEQLMHKARSNVKKEYSSNAKFKNYDPTSLNRLLNELITGISSDNV